MDQWDMAVDMRGHGATWAEINRATGISIDRLRWRLEPIRRAQKREYAKRVRERISEFPTRYRMETRIPAAEVARLLAAIPPDTRDLTARVMGDPLPTRSALYRKMHGDGP